MKKLRMGFICVLTCLLACLGTAWAVEARPVSILAHEDVAVVTHPGLRYSLLERTDFLDSESLRALDFMKDTVAFTQLSGFDVLRVEGTDAVFTGKTGRAILRAALERDSSVCCYFALDAVNRDSQHVYYRWRGQDIVYQGGSEGFMTPVTGFLLRREDEDVYYPIMEDYDAQRKAMVSRLHTYKPIEMDKNGDPIYPENYAQLNYFSNYSERLEIVDLTPGYCYEVIQSALDGDFRYDCSYIRYGEDEYIYPSSNDFVTLEVNNTRLWGNPQDPNTPAGALVTILTETFGAKREDVTFFGAGFYFRDVEYFRCPISAGSDPIVLRGGLPLEKKLPPYLRFAYSVSINNFYGTLPQPVLAKDVTVADVEKSTTFTLANAQDYKGNAYRYVTFGAAPADVTDPRDIADQLIGLDYDGFDTLTARKDTLLPGVTYKVYAYYGGSWISVAAAHTLTASPSPAAAFTAAYPDTVTAGTAATLTLTLNDTSFTGTKTVYLERIKPTDTPTLTLPSPDPVSSGVIPETDRRYATLGSREAREGEGMASVSFTNGVGSVPLTLYRAGTQRLLVTLEGCDGCATVATQVEHTTPMALGLPFSKGGNQDFRFTVPRDFGGGELLCGDSVWVVDQYWNVYSDDNTTVVRITLEVPSTSGVVLDGDTEKTAHNGKIPLTGLTLTTEKKEFPSLTATMGAHLRAKASSFRNYQSLTEGGSLDIFPRLPEGIPTDGSAIGPATAPVVDHIERLHLEDGDPYASEVFRVYLTYPTEDAVDWWHVARIMPYTGRVTSNHVFDGGYIEQGADGSYYYDVYGTTFEVQGGVTWPEIESFDRNSRLFLVSSLDYGLFGHIPIVSAPMNLSSVERTVQGRTVTFTGLTPGRYYLFAGAYSVPPQAGHLTESQGFHIPECIADSEGKVTFTLPCDPEKLTQFTVREVRETSFSLAADLLGEAGELPPPSGSYGVTLRQGTADGGTVSFHFTHHQPSERQLFRLLCAGYDENGRMRAMLGGDFLTDDPATLASPSEGTLTAVDYPLTYTFSQPYHHYKIFCLDFDTAAPAACKLDIPSKEAAE